MLTRLLGAALLVVLLPAVAAAERCFSNGFEINSTTSSSGWDNFTNATVNATYLRSGALGARVTGPASGTARGVRAAGACGSAAVTNVRYARAYFRIITLPNADTTIMALGGTAFSGYAARVVLTTTGTLELRDEDGLIGTAATTLAVDGTFARIELKVDGSPGAGSDVVTLRVNGAGDEVTSSARTIDTNTFSGIILGANLNAETATTGEWYFDDVGVNNASGSNQTSWPGEGKIINLFVDGDGDTTNRGTQGVDYETCTNNVDPCSAGTGGSVSAMLDDLDPDSSTTSVDLLTTSANETDPPVILLSMTSATSAGIDSDDTVTFAHIKAHLGSPTSGTRSAVIMCKSSTSYCTQTSASIAGTTYAWDHAWFTPAELIAYTDPATATAWTNSGLDSMQAGIRAGADSTPFNRVSMIMVLVEYVSVTAGGSSPAGGLLRGFLR